MAAAAAPQRWARAAQRALARGPAPARACSSQRKSRGGVCAFSRRRPPLRPAAGRARLTPAACGPVSPFAPQFRARSASCPCKKWRRSESSGPRKSARLRRSTSPRRPSGRRRGTFRPACAWLAARGAQARRRRGRAPTRVLPCSRQRAGEAAGDRTGAARVGQGRGRNAGSGRAGAAGANEPAGEGAPRRHDRRAVRGALHAAGQH